MSAARVIRNGVQVDPDWDERFAEAQAWIEYEIEGQNYRRIPYGREARYIYYGHQPERPCYECAVLVGQLHLPGCDWEECPRCHGQSISCSCDDQEEEEEEYTGP